VNKSSSAKTFYADVKTGPRVRVKAPSWYQAQPMQYSFTAKHAFGARSNNRIAMSKVRPWPVADDLNAGEVQSPPWIQIQPNTHFERMNDSSLHDCM
jgi:hypothetical protein